METTENLLKDEQDKSCLFNIIIYTHEARRTAYFKEVAQKVRQQFPCHVIFIQRDLQDTKNDLNIHVTAQKDKNDQEFLGDQIFIEVSGEAIQRVPFLILPHLIPDLPIYCLWGQDFIEDDPLLSQLQHMATRLIFDSESTVNLQKFSQALLKRLNESRIPIVDMNWARIKGWRDVIGRTFDSPERLEQLRQAQEIVMTYNQIANPFFNEPDTQAIYIQAWLASSLNWTFQGLTREGTDRVIFYQSSSSKIIIRLVLAQNDEYDSEEVLTVEVKGPKDYLCCLTREGNDQVVVHACDAYACQLPFHFVINALQSGRSFIEEVFYQQISQHYAQMLQMISLAQWSENGKI